MSTKEVTGESLHILDRLTVNLLKAWWKCEAFLERWKREASRGYEDPTEEPPAPRAVAISGQGRYCDRKRLEILEVLLIAGILALVIATVGIMRTSHKLENALIERSARYDGDLARIEQAIRRHDECFNSFDQQRWHAQHNAQR